MKDIILASQSPWRKTILEKTGLPFRVIVSGYEEDMGLKMPPYELIIKMARGKAEAVAEACWPDHQPERFPQPIAHEPLVH